MSDPPLGDAGVVVAHAAGWEAVTASVRGSSHVRKGAPNQDAVLARVSGDGRLLASAVADGHGGARYVRSDVGSMLAVRVATTWGLRVPVDGGERATLRWAREDFVPGVVDAWRADVERHLAANPFTPQEQATYGSGSDPTVAYGSTLLVAVASAGGVLIAQLGDGDAIVIPDDGPARLAVEDHERHVAGVTTSLCLPSAVADTRCAYVTDARLVVLASDGYGTSFADRQWRDRLATDLRTQDLDAERLRQLLPSWLADSARVGGDDVTVALSIRRAGAAVSAASARAPRKVGNRPVLAAAALVLGAAAGWAGASLARDDAPPTADLPTDEDADAGDGSAAVAAAPTSQATTTSTEPPAPAATPAVDAVAWLVATDASVVEFVPDPADARPFLRSTGGSISATTELWAAGSEWRISGNVLQVTDSEDRQTTSVGTGGVAPGGLAFAGGLVWVVDADATTIVAVDPATRTVVGGAVRVAEAEPRAGSEGSTTTQGDDGG